MPPFKSDEFKKLQKEWYGRLQKEGFVDAEHDEEHLKVWHSHLFKTQNPVSAKAKEEYYRLAGQFLNSYPFESQFDRSIWRLHAEGVSRSVIAKQVRREGKRMSESVIQRVITRLSNIMVEQCQNSNRDL